MHLKSVFPNNSQQWLPDRREFRDFVRKCWKADTNETYEIFNSGSRIVSLMYWLFLSSSKRHLFGERYATSVSIHSTETKSHAP